MVVVLLIIMELLVEKIRVALSYHKNQEDVAEELSRAHLIELRETRIFTPRLYTTEKYCASLSIDYLHNLLAYHRRSLLFSSHKHTAEHLGEDQAEWAVDVYPKGVWFQRGVAVYSHLGISGLEVEI